MRKALITLLLLAPLLSFAQFTITGKVIAKEGGSAVQGASVFLSNTGAKTGSAEDGSFALKNVYNGKYDLVVSSVGFEPYHQEITVNGADITMPVVQLLPKVNQLKEVVFGKGKPDRNRAEYLRWFISEFLGEGPNAKKCKILNTEVIDLRYVKRSGVIKARSDEFIVVENRALGYNIKYLLDEFSLSSDKTRVFFAGSAAFEALAGTPEEEKEWEQKRLESFNGSAMHFLRSSLHNQLVDESFTVKNDDGDKLTEDKLLRRTDKEGVYALTSPKELVIRYGKKSSRVTELTFHEKYVFFDLNGVILNPQSNTMKGFWGRQRMADMLPVDYRRPGDIL